MRRSGYAVLFAVVVLTSCAVAFLAGRYAYQRLRQDFQVRAAWTPPAANVAATTLEPPQVTEVAQAGGTRIPSATSRPFRITVAAPNGTPVGSGAPAAGDTPAPQHPEPSATAPQSAPEAAAAAEPSATGTAGPDVTATPTASEAQAGRFEFGLSRPVRNSSGDCPQGAYILGVVSDDAGKPLPGVRVWLVDEWGNQDTKVTKDAAPDTGRYDFPLFGPPRRFYLTVVDGSGHPISPRVEVSHGIGANASATCHWVDWRR